MRKLPELDQIVGFLTVAEELNFRRAAERLAVDGSALSRRIKGLEERLGYTLLLRTTHAVRLTEAGEAFYRANSEIVGSLRAAIDKSRLIARGAAGRLRIAYVSFAAVDLIPEAVRRFSAAFPGVTLDLSYLGTLAQKLALARGEIDLGVMLGPFEPADFGRVEISNDRLCAVMSERRPLASAKGVTLEAFVAEPMIMGAAAQWDFYRGLVDEALAMQGHKLNVAFECSDLSAILGMVRAGLGVTLLPRPLARSCPPGLAFRELPGAEVSVSTIAAWRQPPGRHVTEFVKTLKQCRLPAKTDPAG